MRINLLVTAAILLPLASSGAPIMLEDFETGVLPRHEGSAVLDLERVENPGAGGSGSLRATLRHNAADPRAAHSWLVKDFATPVDMSGMETMTLKYRSDQANPALRLGIRLIDGSGGELRVLEHRLMESSQPHWRPVAWPLSSFESGAQGINLSDIRRMSLHVLNGEALAADGNFAFELDDIMAHTGVGTAREMLLDGFEGYEGDSDLRVMWAPGEGGGTIRMAEEGMRGRRSLMINQFVVSGATEPSVVYSLPSPIDCSAAAYLRVGISGDAALANRKAALRVFLQDEAGNRVIATAPAVPGYTAWNSVMFPFSNRSMWVQDPNDIRPQQAADLASIVAVGLLVTAEDGDPTPTRATVRVDEVRLGFPGSDRMPMGADTVAATATPSAPTLYWSPANDQILRSIRQQGRPLVLFFHRDDLPQCAQFQRNVLESEDFRRAADGFALLVVHATNSENITRQFRISQIPAVVIIDSMGAMAGPYTSEAEQASMINALKTVKR